MKKITQSLVVGLVFFLLAVALAFLTSSPAPAQLTSTPVTVVNTASNPVPINVVGTTKILLNQDVSPASPSVSLDTSAYHEIRVSIAGLRGTGTATVFTTDGALPIQIAQINTGSPTVISPNGAGSAVIELPGRTIQISAHGTNFAGLAIPVQVVVEGRSGGLSND
jgi:hypothetical protein